MRAGAPLPHLVRLATSRLVGFTQMTQWQYKHIRLDYKGRGITQEINLLDIDGERVRGWGSGKEVPTLPEMFEALGKDSWEMVTHVVNQDNTANGTTFHYYNFRRPLQ